jgi:cell division protein FtsW
LAKLAVVVFLPAWLSRRVSRADRELDGANLWAAIGVLGVLCAMIGKEDFGTAFLVAAVGGATLLVNGRRTGTLLAWTLPAMGLGLTMLLMHEYRVRRFTAFLRIWEDPLGDGWHPIQSLAAIASGGWTGRGLGAGISKHGYLPEYRTDFIFALLCEEAGVIGGGIVILLFIGFVLLGMRVMVTAPAAESGSDGGFRRLFAFAATMMVGSQALMNIAVVTVMAPTKGIALPFVSAGGSSLLCYCLLVGLLAGSSRGRRDGVGDMVIAGDMGSVDAESDNRLAPEAYGAVAGLAP